MSKLVMVSNRLPVSATKKEGRLHFKQSVGGLATGLSSFHKSNQGVWIGWPGITHAQANEKEVRENLALNNCYPVFLSKNQLENYYYGFSNKSIWPLFHYFPSYTIYNESFWKAYEKVNEHFCEEVSKIANSDDKIWIHDYHLMLLPKLLRERLPDVSIGFFLHIPFPSFEIFRLFPWRKQILTGLLGADLIGFHTYDYAHHFLESALHILGYEHDLGEMIVGNRIVKVDAFPMGIDYARFADAAKNSKVQKEVNRISKKTGGRKIILSVDRLDYTKGMLQRLEAFEFFLSKNPGYRKKVTLILVAVPSRTRVEHYERLKKQLDELISRINGRYSTIDWIPIWYLYRSLPFHELTALYNVSDIALITPLRDGMNLIAKEFVATKGNGRGALILSEMAGAAKELGEALIVNPNDKEEIAGALRKALTMPEEEQIKRNKALQKRIKRYNILRWANDFMEALSYTKKLQVNFRAKKLTSSIEKDLMYNYVRSKKRLLLLDYDGTLVPFTDKPEKAKPDAELVSLLQTIAQKPGNELIIISGRDKNTLENWLDDANCGLVAEHGVWIKEKGASWEIIESLQSVWKEEIRPIFERFVDRTPGSFYEEKDFSLVFHYRKVDPKLAPVRVPELEATLLHLTTHLDLRVLKGNKVIEIKNTGINKGSAVLKWISKTEWDFILAIGDDLTDEDMFAILPEFAYSIKVGLGSSKAKFNVESFHSARLLLSKLAQD